MFADHSFMQEEALGKRIPGGGDYILQAKCPSMDVPIVSVISLKILGSMRARKEFIRFTWSVSDRMIYVGKYGQKRAY